MSIYEKLLIRGREIFLLPDEEYPASDIIIGVHVNNGDKTKLMRAIDNNTYRGFHRINKSLKGPKEIVEIFINSRLSWIIDCLKIVQNKQKYEYICKTITEELREQLKKNVKHHMLESYNKVRKPVDLILEHIVSMATELTEYRKSLIPFLAVPLDSHILNSDFIFDQKSKALLGIKRGATYSDISCQRQYDDIQAFIQEKAADISTTFYPIYFDLLWNDRYRRNGGNLFKINP
jgi:hypothetical protein